MKITFILPCYPIRPIGGFRIVYEYANELVKRGHKITIIHPAFVVHPAYGNHMGENDLLPPPPVIDWQQINSDIEMKYVLNLDEQYIPEADAIIATAWYTADYVNNYSPSKGVKFYLIQSHEIWDGPEDLVNQTWHYPMNKIVVSKWLLNIAENMNVSNVIHIPNAINHEKFHVKVPIAKRAKKVAMLFNNQEIKGAMDGLKALELAKKEIPDLEAVIFGVPRRNRAIRRWIKYIRNPTQEQLIEEIYNGCSIFLCPSWIEGWGLPSTEAMACGCALVSADNGGVKDYAEHNKNALINPPKDPRKLADNIIRLAKDDTFRIRIAENGLKSTKNFNFKNSTDLLEAYLLSKCRVGKIENKEDE